jgi:hypothetical protein
MDNPLALLQAAQTLGKRRPRLPRFECAEELQFPRIEGFLHLFQKVPGAESGMPERR